MVKYGDSAAGRARRQRSRHRSNSNQSMPFRFFFLFPSPSLLLRLFLSMKRKSRTSCQPIALAFGPLSAGWSKEIIRELVKIVHIAEDDHENFGEGRWKGFSCVGIFVMRWSSTKNRRSLLDFSGAGAGEEQEKHSRCYPKRVDWAAKKLILDRREKLSLGWYAIGHGRKQN